MYSRYNPLRFECGRNGELVKIIERNKPPGSDEITFLKVAPEPPYPEGGWLFDMKKGHEVMRLANEEEITRAGVRASPRDHTA